MLKKYDYKIINLDKLTYAGNLENLVKASKNNDYTFVKGDICDKELVLDLLSNCDAIINFAAESHVDRSIESPDIFIQTNVNGTVNLLNCARAKKIERFIQISTDEVYGSIKEGYFTETTPISPNSPYSSSKASADLFVQAYFKTYGLPALITRCSNNYGPYQYPEKLIPFFITRLLDNKKVPVYGDGQNVRDWLYVEDHCRGIDLVLHKGCDGEIYNIGGHNEKTNIEITKIILEKMGKDENCIEYVEDRLGHDRRYAISNDKIRNKLGFEVKYSFENGISDTIDWYLKNIEWINNIKNRMEKY
jgi:dTDP-glucose 4,6-dehydratase